MKLGTENKKATYALAGLLTVLAYFMYSNFFSGPSAPPPSAVTPPSASMEPPSIARADVPAAPRRPQAERSGGEEFHPVLRSTHSEERIDPMTVDPTLHLELLQRLQEAASDAGGRNLFQFGAPPPPPPTPEQIARLNHPEPVVTPQPQVMAPAGPPPPPAEPPISIKYYGLSTRRANGKKVAFFMDGDNIMMAGEGELLQKRYRVVRIGVNSVVVEDTQLKREQSLPLSGESATPQPGENVVAATPAPPEPRETMMDELNRARPAGPAGLVQPQMAPGVRGFGLRGAPGTPPNGPGGNR